MLRKAITLVLVLLGFAVDAQAQSLASLFSRIELSVVKVRCPDTGHSATGFVWSESRFVVSSLHVVDGSGSIQVYYPANRLTRPARVVRVLQHADLVLLQVENAPDVPVLKQTAAPPSLDEEVHALGFALNFPTINSFTFKLRYGGKRLRDNISDKVLARIRNNGYPSPDLEVVKLGQESLLPGLSGSPIFNARGEVVAIGDGGLEEGALNVSWGIPASHLASLMASMARSLPGAPGTRELFAAELKSQIGDVIKSGPIQLVKMRTRSFPELIASTDDALGLQQLVMSFSGFNQMSFEYDIYQDIGSGATVVLPKGSSVEPQQDGFWKITPPETSLDRVAGRQHQMILQIKKTDSLGDANRQSILFEEELKRRHHPVQWQVDPRWSYYAPYTRFDGLVVRRMAAAGVLFNGYSWINQKYMFETLAVRDNIFVGLALINQAYTPQAAEKEMMCMQGYSTPDCQLIYESRRSWVQELLGVHLTSFGL